MAICSMIFGGVFERFPKLKVCFAHGGIDQMLLIHFNCSAFKSQQNNISRNIFLLHAPLKMQLAAVCCCCLTFLAFVPTGGSFPFTVGRIEHGHKVRPDLCAVDNRISPKKYLGSFYTDSLVHDPISLKLLIDVIGKVSLCSSFIQHTHRVLLVVREATDSEKRNSEWFHSTDDSNYSCFHQFDKDVHICTCSLHVQHYNSLHACIPLSG